MHCYKRIGFVDNNAEFVFNKKVIGKQKGFEILHSEFDCAFVTIGDNQIRKKDI